MKDKERIIDNKNYLKAGRLITVHQHEQLTESPEHRHNYIEIMYVKKGTFTHCIEGKEIVMNQGDMLLMNQYVKHSIKKTGRDDVGINFIALPEFFDIPLKMLGGNNVLAEFLINTLRQQHQESNYLLFSLGSDRGIENLVENMIESALNQDRNYDIFNQYSMGLVFLYLMNHIEHLTTNFSKDAKDVMVQSVLNYIDTYYKTANLTKIAEDFFQSVSGLSKLIKQKTGCTFQELLHQKRFEKAIAFLMETDLSIEEVVRAVGYENQSYFYRQFKERYGMTPRDYRVKYKSGK